MIEKQNPITILCYLFFVIFITMFSTNPIMLGISFVSGILLYCMLCGVKKTLVRLGYFIIFVAIIAIINPIFSRQGMTQLFWIGDFVVTLEALLNGVAIGVMFGSVIIWFGVLNVLLYSDKIIYIFGKFTPKIGTILSIALGLFPKYIVQYRKIDNNLKGLGLYDGASFLSKVKLKMHTLSTLITWSVEGAVLLSDNMSARGYDLKDKRIYGKYTFGVADGILLIVSLALGTSILVFMGLGSCNFYYYPTFKQIVWDSSVWIYFVTFVFMNILAVINLWEGVKWQFLKSKI